MKILIDDKMHKTNNFINYLIESYSDKGEKYSFKLYVKDKYDKRLADKRYNELNGNILVHHEDGFDVLGKEVLKDFDKFKSEVLDLCYDEKLKNDINKDNYKKELIKYKLDFFEDEKFLNIDFQYIKLIV
jgi:hypothetical protein